MSGATIFLGVLLIAGIAFASSGQGCAEDSDCAAEDVCADGFCVMLPSRKCPKGMHYHECGPTCPERCTAKAGQNCPDLCIEGCFCNENLVFSDDGNCVSRDHCGLVKADVAKRETKERKQDPRCPKNAEYRECTPVCPEKHCGNILEVASCFSLRCGAPGCMCVEGHVRKSANFKEGCVRRETCLAESRKNKAQRQKRQSNIPGVPIPVCKDNEELKSCGTACEPSCKNPAPLFCTLQCAVNQCECKRGLLRHGDGSCVTHDKC